MLTIRSSQQSSLQAAKVRQFEAAMKRHIETVYPLRCAKWGDVGTAEFVSRSMKRATEHEIVTTGAIVALLELLAEFGEQFSESPDSEEALQLLDDPELPGQIKIQLLVACLHARTGGRRIVSAAP